MAYTYARRNELARQAGFASYSEQRRRRAEAQGIYPTPRTREGVALRDRIALLKRDYTPGDMTRAQIQKRLGLRRGKPSKRQARLLRNLSPKRAREPRGT